MNSLRAFLKSRDAISILPLEREVGCPLQTIKYFVKEERSLPLKWLWPVCVTLSKYGLQLGPVKIIYFANRNIFRMYKEENGMLINCGSIDSIDGLIKIVNQQERIVLLLEDDCAPDAREYFEKSLKEKFGLTMQDFIEKGEKIEFGYKLGKYILECFPDDPFWCLSSFA